MTAHMESETIKKRKKPAKTSEAKTENQNKELKMRITALEETLTTERTKIQKEEEKNKKNTQTIKQLQGKINQTRENNKKEMKKEE